VQAAAERVQNSEHFGEAHRGLSAFQFDQEADADIGRCSQLILAEALGKPSLRDILARGLMKMRLVFPIRKSWEGTPFGTVV